jgi:hypothetical protein
VSASEPEKEARDNAPALKAETHFEDKTGRFSQEQLQKLDEAFDKVLATLSGKPIEILGPESMQKAFAFTLWETMERKARRPRRCVMPGCMNQSIPASHTLQRNGPLAAIADKNHVLSPSFDLRRCAHVMGRIGIGRASTFPGFCSKHEAMFSELEARRSLTTDDDVKRQVFRTVCRELFEKRRDCHDLESYLRVWQIVISLYGSQMVNAAMGTLLPPNNKVRSVTTNSTSPLERFITHELEVARENVHWLDTVMLPASLADVENREPSLAHVVFRIEQSLPVCLAGLGNFCVQSGERVEPITAMLNVWPTPQGVTIVMSAPVESQEHLHTYFYSRVARSLGPLEMVETWMMNGTNHWFIQPSVWEKIPAGRAARILAHIGERHHDIGTPYHLSVFDELRRNVLGGDESGFDRAAEERKLAE